MKNCNEQFGLLSAEFVSAETVISDSENLLVQWIDAEMNEHITLLDVIYSDKGIEFKFSINGNIGTIKDAKNILDAAANEFKCSVTYQFISSDNPHMERYIGLQCEILSGNYPVIDYSIEGTPVYTNTVRCITEKTFGELIDTIYGHLVNVKINDENTIIEVGTEDIYFIKDNDIIKEAING